jgi:hypothetical protein
MVRGAEWKRLGSVVMVLGWTSACGSGDDLEPAPPVEQDQFPEAAATSICDGLATCCAGAGQSVDRAACVSQMRSDISIPTVPGMKYEPSLGGQCVADLRTSLSNCFGLDDPPPACEAMFHGTVALGGACTSTSECTQPASGRVTCSFDLATQTSGICTLYPGTPRVALGQFCGATCVTDGTDTLCMSQNSLPGPDAGSCYTDDGLYCDPETLTCAATPQVGEECFTTVFCAAGARCGSSAVCEALKADGQPCAGSDECTGYCLRASGSANGVCASGRERFVPTADQCQEYDLD